jgi:hypothetical protein
LDLETRHGLKGLSKAGTEHFQFANAPDMFSYRAMTRGDPPVAQLRSDPGTENYPGAHSWPDRG